MPNHVINEVTLHGCGLDKVKPLLSGECVIDFAVLLPAPLNCWQGSSNIKTDEAFPHGWYDWNRKNWGTKWNAYGLSEDALCEVDDSTVLTFQTAWSTPRGWILALFNSCKCNITVKHLDEGRADGCEEAFLWEDATRLNGPSWTQSVIPEKSPEHRRLHMLLWGVEEHTDEDA